MAELPTVVQTERAPRHGRRGRHDATYFSDTQLWNRKEVVLQGSRKAVCPSDGSVLPIAGGQHAATFRESRRRFGVHEDVLPVAGQDNGAGMAPPRQETSPPVPKKPPKPRRRRRQQHQVKDVDRLVVRGHWDGRFDHEEFGWETETAPQTDGPNDMDIILSRGGLEELGIDLNQL